MRNKRKGLYEKVERLSEDPSVGAIVLTGAGRAFCSGGDVKNMAAGKNEMCRFMLNMSRNKVAVGALTRLSKILSSWTKLTFVEIDVQHAFRMQRM